jgi:chromosome segregation ATPase
VWIFSRNEGQQFSEQMTDIRMTNRRISDVVDDISILKADINKTDATVSYHGRKLSEINDSIESVSTYIRKNKVESTESNLELNRINACFHKIKSSVNTIELEINSRKFSFVK